MSVDKRIIMDFNKLRHCCKLISFKSLHQSSYIISKSSIYDKLLKITSYRTFFHGNLKKDSIKLLIDNL